MAAVAAAAAEDCTTPTNGVVGADAMTTALRMVGSPPPMMDGPSDLGGQVCPWVLPIAEALSC